MKVIVAGSRTIEDYATVKRAIERSGFEVTEVFSGHARGVDRLGEQWARETGVGVRLFVPLWTDRGAGIRRNAEMAREAEALVAVWDGSSKGCANMILTARKKGLKVYVEVVR